MQERNRVAKSEALYERALEIIPWGSQTGSKRPRKELQGYYPPYVERGKGAYVWDLDGNRYIDYKLSCGPIILGYAYEPVDQAVKAQIDRGIVFGTAHPLEVQVAEKLIEMVPSAEMVRYLKSGAEVTSAAVRLARAYSGRDLIVSFGYHGWHDWCIGRGKGVPKAFSALTIAMEYDDLEGLERLLKQRAGEIAGLIVTPPIYSPDSWNTTGEFLKTCRRLATEYGVVLIYDEVVSGFRVDVGGAAQYFDAVPDIAVFSKAIANGYPMGAVVGKRQYMEAWNDAVITSTFGGDTVGLAAAQATLNEYQTKDVIGHLRRLGTRLIEGVREIAGRVGVNVEAGGCPSLPSLLNFPDATKEEAEALNFECQKVLLRAGVMPYHSNLWYLSYSHSDADTNYTLQAIEDALKAIKR